MDAWLNYSLRTVWWVTFWETFAYFHSKQKQTPCCAFNEFKSNILFVSTFFCRLRAARPKQAENLMQNQNNAAHRTMLKTCRVYGSSLCFGWFPLHRVSPDLRHDGCCSCTVNPGQLSGSLAFPTKTKMQALPRSHSDRESANTELNKRQGQWGLKREEVEEQEGIEDKGRMDQIPL